MTLRERIKAALDEDAPNTPNIWWKHERLAKAARELLPLVLVELDRLTLDLSFARAEVDVLRIQLATIATDRDTFVDMLNRVIANREPSV